MRGGDELTENFEGLIKDYYSRMESINDNEFDSYIKELEMDYVKNIQNNTIIHWKTAAILEILSKIYLKTGKYNNAEETLKTLLEIKKEIFGNGDFSTLKTLNSLSNVLYVNEKYEESEELYLEELSVRNNILLVELSSKSRRSVTRSNNKTINSINKDNVNFSVIGPKNMIRGGSYVLEVWAHLKDQKEEIDEIIKKDKKKTISRKGPVPLEKGTTITFKIEINGLDIKNPTDIIYWVGEISNASFPIDIPLDAKKGDMNATITIFVDNFLISTLHFILAISDNEDSANNIPVSENKFQSAFISYSSLDLYDVLARVQGILKIRPDFDLFIDFMSMKSGDFWQERIIQEIKDRDKFYLFWSKNAAQSKWVEKEWKSALELKGIDKIEPFPLDNPKEVPPPPELNKLHFNDPILPYMD